LSLCLAWADAPPAEEVWELAQCDEARIGFVHTTVQRLEDQRLRTTADMDLTFRRQGALVRVRVEQGTEETPAGQVVGVFMRQYNDRGLALALTGTLQDPGRMHVDVDKGRIVREVPWSEDVVGLAARLHYFEKHPPRTGDRFTLPIYEPTVNSILTLRAVVGPREDVAVLGKRQSLLRVDLKPDRIEAPGIKLQLPASVVWLDEHGIAVRRQIELDGLGPLVLTRTTKAIATTGTGGTVRAPDIGTRTLIPLGRPIERPYATRSAHFRVTLQGDAEPAEAFVVDDHQEIQDLKGRTFTLWVHPVPVGAANRAAPKAPAAEYLASCYYIPSADPGIQELARKAAEGETDAWRKAQKLERWVKTHMQVDNTAPLVPADKTARELRGDCRHHALLTAALCRAQGLPSRTAIGLIYVHKRGQRPAMGFHMWTEVWIHDRWLGLDATLGQGGVSAMHVKITQHSWHDVRSLTPLLPVARVLGKLQMEVVQTE
jgi:transglutaminase-like putative cysteine protease